MKENNDHAFFKEVMSKSKLELNSADFEDKVMMQIQKQKLYRESYSNDIKKSWISFTAGTVFGIILSTLLAHFEISLLGISADSFLFVFQMLFSLFVLLSLDLLIRYTPKLSINKLFNWKPKSPFYKKG